MHVVSFTFKPTIENVFIIYTGSYSSMIFLTSLSSRNAGTFFMLTFSKEKKNASR